jgi:predicted acylesterase/phospholipase RssA
MPSDEIENVLILQGGGSLGAFGCGVFKECC